MIECHTHTHPEMRTTKNPNAFVMSHDLFDVIIQRLQIPKCEIFAGAPKDNTRNSRLILRMAVQIMVAVVALVIEPQGVI